MNDDLAQPLSDDDLDELNEILQQRGDGHGIGLDALHGLFSALAAGPDSVPPEEWMPHVVDDGRPFASVEQAERALGLILRLNNTVIQDLERDRYEPILGEVENDDGSSALTARGWCEGFSLGVDLRAELWEERMRADGRLLELLGPVIQLSADEGVFQADGEEVLPPLTVAEYDRALEALPDAVVAVQRYWREHPPGAPIPEGMPTPRQRGGRWVH
jgi:uncharacterized protein